MACWGFSECIWEAASATLEYEQKRVQDDFAKTQCPLGVTGTERSIGIDRILLAIARYEHKKRAAQKQAHDPSK